MTSHSWTPPAGLRGEAQVIRLSASALDQDGRRCPAHAALKARPQLWPRVYEKRRYAPWETFPLGLVQAALDLVEYRDMPVEDAVASVVSGNRATVHAGVAVWVGHACDAYLEAAEWIADDLEEQDVVLVPDRLPRIVQYESAAERRMLTAWGRWYASPDGGVREFRRLRMGRAGERDAPSNDALAFVAAAGQRAEGNVYRDMPVSVVPDEREASRVRVVEVVLAAGVPPRVVMDAPPADIRRVYREKTRHLVTGIVFADVRKPGSDCVGCKARSSCDALPHAPGLLGIEGGGTHRRTWSVTTGRQYLICPAQAHLRELHLPAAAWSDGSAARRGRAVHRWLEAAHGRRPARGCDLADLPSADAGDLGLAAQVMTPEEYREARPYLVSHLAVCPMAGAVGDVVVEPNVAAYDPAAEVVVVAYPDLVREVGGRVVYREQKTTRMAAPGGEADEVFTRVPQLALAVRLIEHGVLGGDGTGAVELETMTPDAAVVLSFDAGDPAVREAAARVITRMAARWHADSVFRPDPGPWCGTCPVAQWCPDRAPSDPKAPIVVDGVRIDPRTGEVLSASGPVSDRAEAVSDDIADPEADDDPPPF
ncbi:PD-(D/E)XK nuclease family protein [Actinomadura sp. NAK00032]|uniref:PD-(D/E)XK nuclease family protein n=1 Tax=Actinomadura sp. NAK00032 TaxID=2742128 RepID=UPI0015916827|nr:PD-(D/E)XK nuclease family protein [Actinomadura sp. NAK00032]QKW37308.1 PD-(D/E)XK nuclease family protein [Actinomadura sp. NAK00032]